MDKLKFLLSLLKGYRLKYFLSLIAIVLTSMLVLANQYMVKKIVDEVLIAKHNELLMTFLLIVFFATFIRMLARFICLYNFEQVSQNIMLNLRNEGFKKILSLDFSYFDKHRTGDIMTQMTMDLDLVRHFFAHVLYTSIENLFIFTGSVIMMLTIVDKSFLVFIIIVFPLVLYYAVQLSRRIRSLWVNIRNMRSRLNTVAQENIGANRVVKAFAREEFENHKMNEANLNFKKAQTAANKVWRKYLPWLGNVQGLFMMYNIIAGGIMVITGKITMGDLVMFNGMVWMITGPLGMAGWLANDIANCAASVEKIMELLETEPDIKNKGKTASIKTIKGDFEFANVSFGYEQEDHALHKVSFSVHKGQKVAIIGPTGSGKSSIINLLCRFYDVERGYISVDGRDIRELPLEVLRGNIALAQQDVFLFSDTIADNIAYGNTAATREDIIAAAKASHAHDFIMKMPSGYDTVVGERGVGLSGGQKQRVTLARALLKNPQVLILDDTTSALDSKTERSIQARLNEYFANKTVFIISQRIASVKDCDIILVLDKGRIVESGTHEELLENKGYYYNVFCHQYGEFVNKGAVLNG